MKKQKIIIAIATLLIISSLLVVGASQSQFFSPSDTESALEAWLNLAVLVGSFGLLARKRWGWYVTLPLLGVATVGGFVSLFRQMLLIGAILGLQPLMSLIVVPISSFVDPFSSPVINIFFIILPTAAHLVVITYLYRSRSEFR